jgi:glycosyltransferase involved in cell wall biosynthesis
MKFTPENWAIVGFNDATGLGRQSIDIRKVLELGWHLVKPSERLINGQLSGSREVVIDELLNEAKLDEIVSQLDGLIFLESPYSQNTVLAAAERRRKPCILIPNWEWFPGIRQKQCRRFSLFIAPTHYTARWLKRFLLGPIEVIPPPVNLESLPWNPREGFARTFVHNAGIIDSNDRKSTHLVLSAFLKSARMDIRLKVRLQKPLIRPELAELAAQDSRISIEVGSIPDHAALYLDGDIFVQPSRLEGIGFQIVEALLCGAPVVTTDYPPMNEWVTNKELLVRASWGFSLPKTFRTSIFQSHLKNPVEAELISRFESLPDIDLSRFSQRCQELRESVFDPNRLRQRFAEAIGKHL